MVSMIGFTFISNLLVILLGFCIALHAILVSYSVQMRLLSYIYLSICLSFGFVLHCDFRNAAQSTFTYLGFVWDLSNQIRGISDICLMTISFYIC